jgi:hypothetical protein
MEARRFWILFLFALRRDLLGTLQLATEGMLAGLVLCVYFFSGRVRGLRGVGDFYDICEELFSDLLSGGLTLSIELREPPRLCFDQS